MIVPSLASLDPQGPVAESMADLYWLMLVVGTVVFVLFAVLLVAGLARRHRHPVDLTSAEEAPLVRRWIVGGGVVLPTVVLIGILAATVVAMRDVSTSAPAGALQVEVVGHQWWYEVRYVDSGVVTANELHLPVGEPVELHLTSADVIHSFWVPELAGKLDMLPDGVNTMVIEASESGEHTSRCAEFCGLQHAEMALVVVAEPAADFEAWVAEQQRPAVEPTSARAARGQERFASVGCASCHTVRGSGAASASAPDLTHLASRRTLGSAMVPNTTTWLERWVRDPHDVKPGVHMPATEIDEEGLRDIVAYLEGLR